MPRIVRQTSLQEFHEILHYNPDTGWFTWRVKKALRVNVGDRAGCFNKATGYRAMRINGVSLPEHRVAWFYTHGEWPQNMIDHINGDKTDNRIANLRDIPNRMNCHNRQRAQKDNQLGILGVTKSCSRYAATIKHHGKKIWIGTFDTPELAHEAYLKKKREIHEANTL